MQYTYLYVKPDYSSKMDNLSSGNNTNQSPTAIPIFQTFGDCNSCIVCQIELPSSCNINKNWKPRFTLTQRMYFNWALLVIVSFLPVFLYNMFSSPDCSIMDDFMNSIIPSIIIIAVVAFIFKYFVDQIMYDKPFLFWEYDSMKCLGEFKHCMDILLPKGMSKFFLDNKWTYIKIGEPDNQKVGDAVWLRTFIENLKDKFPCKIYSNVACIIDIREDELDPLINTSWAEACTNCPKYIRDLEYELMIMHEKIEILGSEY